MTLAILAGIALSAASSISPNAGPLHETTVQHGPVSMNVDYHAATKIRMRNINLLPANRAGTGACRWSAQIQVERRVHFQGSAVAGLAKPVEAPLHISGVQPGMCAAAGNAIESSVASRIDKLRKSVAGIAQEDRGILISEIESLQTLPKSSTG